MKRLIHLVILAMSTTLAAQQTIPAVVVNTCTFSNGVITINGVPVNQLTLNQLTLNGGTNYADGAYLSTFTGGKRTFTPYVAGGGSTPVTAGFSNTAVAAMQAGSATATYTVTIPAVVGTNYADVYPLFDPGVPFAYTAVVSAANTVTVRIWNRTFSNASLAAGKWIVAVH